MKASRYIALFLLFLVILAGCAEKDKAVPEEKESKIEDFFPMVENARYTYEGTGNEFAGYSVFVDYTSKNKIQQKIENGGTVVARVYEMQGGKLIVKLSKGEVYYRENMLQKTDGSDEVMLMEPLAKGTAWTLKDGSERTITGTDTPVKTPLGTLPCLEVITEGRDGTTIHYYAKDIGLVKTIFRSGGLEVISTLKSIEKDAVNAQNVRIYLPDAADGSIYFVEKEVSYRTNDDTGKVLETVCKNTINDLFGQVLSDGAAINSLALDEERRVRLDVSASLAADLNAAAEYEPVILQCLVNTLGYYYNSENVILTVDGEPYRSERIQMEKGQAFPVNLEELNQKGGAS